MKNAEFDASKIETLYVNGCRDLELRYVVSNKVYYDTSETLLSINKGTYVNEQNELVIACKYGWAATFNGGSAQVELDGDYMTIGTDGAPCND